ncbi:hypothetical protein [Natrarchaeobius halalkaliphilus]|nr:hypothetical protein [Natrarchaeobius halalkaliphilus]
MTDVIATLSIHQIASERATDPLSWIAAFLVSIVLLPCFDWYQRWVSRALRTTDSGAKMER